MWHRKKPNAYMNNGLCLGPCQRVASVSVLVGNMSLISFVRIESNPTGGWVLNPEKMLLFLGEWGATGSMKA